MPHELVAEVLILARKSWVSALPLSQICRAWRQVAITTPQLWTVIEFSVQSWTLDSKMSLLKTFCKRISGLQLSVTITSDESQYDQDFDGEELVQALTPYLKQIDSLSLTVPGDTFLALFNLPADSFSHLKSFLFSSEWVFIPDHGELIEPIPGIVSFASARHLSRFTYHGRLPSSTVVQLPEQLAEISLRGIATSQCMQILQYTPNLTSLAYAMTSWEIGETPHNQAIVMLQLQELDLDMKVHIGHLINYITAPSLQTFKLDGNSCIDSWSMVSFSSFLARSTFSLTQLSLKNVNIRSAEFLRCLSLFPTLTELDLQDLPCLDDSTLNQLIYRPEHQFNLLPALSVFNVKMYGSRIQSVYTCQLYIDIVKSLWWPDTNRTSQLSLCRLAFGSSSVSQEHARLQVDMLRSEGLDITLTFVTNPSILFSLGEEVCIYVPLGRYSCAYLGSFIELRGIPIPRIRVLSTPGICRTRLPRILRLARVRSDFGLHQIWR